MPAGKIDFRVSNFSFGISEQAIKARPELRSSIRSNAISAIMRVPFNVSCLSIAMGPSSVPLSSLRNWPSCHFICSARSILTKIGNGAFIKSREGSLCKTAPDLKLSIATGSIPTSVRSAPFAVWTVRFSNGAHWWKPSRRS